jgi:hypothetical protein
VYLLKLPVRGKRLQNYTGLCKKEKKSLWKVVASGKSSYDVMLNGITFWAVSYPLGFLPMIVLIYTVTS